MIQRPVETLKRLIEPLTKAKTAEEIIDVLDADKNGKQLLNMTLAHLLEQVTLRELMSLDELIP